MFLGNFSIISCFPNRILCVKHDLTNLAIVFININFNEMTFFSYLFSETSLNGAWINEKSPLSTVTKLFFRTIDARLPEVVLRTWTPTTLVEFPCVPAASIPDVALLEPVNKKRKLVWLDEAATLRTWSAASFYRQSTSESYYLTPSVSLRIYNLRVLAYRAKWYSFFV